MEPLAIENADSREEAGRSPKSPLGNTPERNSPNVDRENTSSPRSDCGSPEPNCAICLGKSRNKSFTDSCLHQFCFQCLLEWSKVKAECPLCKQGFKSIIHNVRSIEDYDQYHLRPVENHPWVNLINIDVGLVDVGAQRYQYSSALINRRLRERTISLQQRLLDLQQSGDAIPPQRTRRRRRGFATEDFRRSVYLQDIWVDYVANVNGARDILPFDFRTRPQELQRLTPWLNRELLALALLTTTSRIAHVLNLTLSLVSCFHIRSPEFRQAIDAFFNAYTDHFIHEFYTFARSGYDMVGFDENAHYVSRNNIALEVVHGTSSDSDDSDVIYLSSSNAPLPPEPEPPRSQSRSHSSTVNSSLQSRENTVPDSPVAGPSRTESFPEEVSDTTSYICNSSVSEADSGNEFQDPRQPSVVTNASAQVQIQPGPSSQDIQDSDDSDSCLIVGYLKPIHERTPEIITLTSDVSEPEMNDTREEIIEEYREPCVESVQHCTCENWLKSCGIHSTPAPESSDSEYLPSSERLKRRKKCKEKQKAVAKTRKKSNKGIKNEKPEKPTKNCNKKRICNVEHSHSTSGSSCDDCYSNKQKLSQQRRMHLISSSSSSCSSRCSSHSRYSRNRSNSSSSCSGSFCSDSLCRNRSSSRENIKAYKTRTNSRGRKLHNDKKYKSKSKRAFLHTDHDYTFTDSIASGTSTVHTKHKAPQKIRSIIIRRSNPDDSGHKGSSKHTHKGKSKRKGEANKSRDYYESFNGRDPAEIWNIVKREYPSTSSAGYRYDYPHTTQSYRYESSINGTKNSGKCTERKGSKHKQKRREKRRISSDTEAGSSGRKITKLRKRKKINLIESDSSNNMGKLGVETPKQRSHLLKIAAILWFHYQWQQKKLNFRECWNDTEQCTNLKR